MKKLSRALLPVFFAAAGMLHFIRTPFYMKIMPPYVPLPLAMVYLSGFLEIIFAVLFCSGKTRRFAAWGLVLLLVAVFPANVHLALHPEIFPSVPAWAAWLRLPLQGLLIGWVCYTRKP